MNTKTWKVVARKRLVPSSSILPITATKQNVFFLISSTPSTCRTYLPKTWLIAFPTNLLFFQISTFYHAFIIPEFYQENCGPMLLSLSNLVLNLSGFHIPFGPYNKFFICGFNLICWNWQHVWTNVMNPSHPVTWSHF